MKIKKYGIEITKPWSKEMYDHNDEVLSEVKQLIGDKWLHAYHDSENVYESNVEDHDPEFMESDWEYEANATLKDIPKLYLFFLKNNIVNLDKIKKTTKQKKKDIK